MLPFLQKLIRILDRRQTEYFLFLSLGVMGTAPLVTIFFPSLFLSPYFTSGMIGVNIGMVVLGYYLERCYPMTKQTASDSPLQKWL